jgi:hypothetical protein
MVNPAATRSVVVVTSRSPSDPVPDQPSLQGAARCSQGRSPGAASEVASVVASVAPFATRPQAVAQLNHSHHVCLIRSPIAAPVARGSVSAEKLARRNARGCNRPERRVGNAHRAPISAWGRDDPSRAAFRSRRTRRAACTCVGIDQRDAHIAADLAARRGRTFVFLARIRRTAACAWGDEAHRSSRRL